MKARRQWQECIDEKNTLIARHKQLRHDLPGIMMGAQQGRAGETLSAQEWAMVQADIAQARNLLGQLERMIPQAEQKIEAAAEVMETARKDYVVMRNAHDRLQKMLNQIDDDERLLEEITSENNEDFVYKRKPTRKQKEQKALRRKV